MIPQVPQAAGAFTNFMNASSLGRNILGTTKTALGNPLIRGTLAGAGEGWVHPNDTAAWGAGFGLFGGLAGNRLLRGFERPGEVMQDAKC